MEYFEGIPEPCPFCGCTQVAAGQIGVADSGKWVASCDECQGEGPVGMSHAEAFTKWNRRPSPDYNSVAS